MSADRFVEMLFGMTPSEVVEWIISGSWFVKHGSLDRFGEWGDIEALRDVDSVLRATRGPINAHCEDRAGGITDISQLRPNTARRLYDVGATLGCPGVDKSVAKVQALAGGLARELGLGSTSCGALVFASPPGTRLGVRPHFDSFDGVVIQLRGSKVWHLARNEHVAFPFHGWPMGEGEPRSEDMSYMPGDLPNALTTEMDRVELHAGSVLCVPRGVWHRTGEVGAGGSIGLTLALTAPPRARMLESALARLLREREAFRVPAYGLGGEDGDRRARGLAELEPLWNDVREKLAKLSLGELLAETIDPPPCVQHGAPPVR